MKKKKNVQNEDVKTLKHKSKKLKKNQFEIKDIHIIIIFALITFLFFREIILQQKFLWEDFIYQYYPFRNFASVSLSNWTLPFWNPYTFGGMPFLADIQTAVFYPLHLLLTFFVKNDQLHFIYLEYLIIFHYFMAGVFSYYLARSLDLNEWASILAGITFMFCGFMVTHAIHETMIIQFAYMPLIFMFYNKSLITNKLKYILLTGLFMGITILCGHPQITLYIFFTFLLFGLYQIFFKSKDNNYKIDVALFRFIVISAIPFVIGIVLGAIQLLPTMTLAELSVRSEISYEASLDSSINYHNLFSLFSPKFFGDFNALNFFGIKDGVEYWGGRMMGGEWGHQYYFNCIYVGLPAVIFGMLGIIALWEKRIVKFLVIISLFSILFALGDNFILYKLFYNFIPGFDKFRFIGVIAILVVSFSFSLLGAYGFDYFINNADGEKIKKFIKYLIILVSTFILLWLLFKVGLFKNMVDVYKDEAVYDNSIFQLLKTVIILSVLLCLVILFRRKSIHQYLSLLLFILLAFTDLYIFGSEHNNSTTNITSYYKENREWASIIKEGYNDELFRIKGMSDNNRLVFIQNQGMIDFIFMLDGGTPLSLKNSSPPYRTEDLMNVKYVPINDTITSNGYNWKFNKSYAPRVWMSYCSIIEPSLDNVAKILEDSTFDIRKKVIIDQEPEIFVDTNTVNIAGYKIDIISYKNNEITLSVETNKNGILVLSEVYYPNWKVFVDDVEKPMLRADYSLRGVALEKGIHKVVFKYVDKDFQIGAIITLFTLAMVIGGFVVERYDMGTSKNR